MNLKDTARHVVSALFAPRGFMTHFAGISSLACQSVGSGRTRRCIDPNTKKGGISMSDKLDLDLAMIDIDPITDEILQQVLGGLGDEDCVANSCSGNNCSTS